MTRVPTICTYEALGGKAPDPITTKVAIRGNFEGLGLECMILTVHAEIAHHCKDGRRLHLCGEAFPFDGVEIFLYRKLLDHASNLITSVLAFSDIFPSLLHIVEFLPFRGRLCLELVDERFALLQNVAQKDFGCFVCHHMILVQPHWRRLEDHI